MVFRKFPIIIFFFKFSWKITGLSTKFIKSRGCNFTYNICMCVDPIPTKIDVYLLFEFSAIWKNQVIKTKQKKKKLGFFVEKSMKRRRMYTNCIFLSISSNGSNCLFWNWYANIGKILKKEFLKSKYQYIICSLGSYK